MLPRHLERSLMLLLDGPAVRRGGEWRQEQPDPDAEPVLIIRRDQTMAALYALGLVEQLSPYRCLARMGLTDPGRALAAGIALRLRAEMAALITTQIAAAAKALPAEPPPRSTDGRTA